MLSLALIALTLAVAAVASIYATRGSD
jgi:hypothetical protein